MPRYYLNRSGTTVRLAGGAGLNISAGGGFATPDILNNASFETDFDGFHDGASGTTLIAATRTNAQAFSGSWSVTRSWSSGSDVESQLFYNISNPTHFFARTYFRLTALPNGGGFKIFRFVDGGYSTYNGMQMEPFGTRWIWVGGSAENQIALTDTVIPADSAWHYVEFEFDQTNKIIRMWQDGTAMGSGGTPDAGLSWTGNDLHYTSAPPPDRLDLIRIINARTNSGSIFIDRVAVSTQRIGP